MTEVKKKKSRKKKKHLIGPKEFLFNFISLVLMIGVGVYFGYRSLYYYSKQNRQYVEEAQTLNGTILHSTHVVYDEEVGLHHDSLGYYYKGNTPNNYVSFGNQLFRIIRIEEDGAVRLISENYVGVFPWGNSANYQESNVYFWLNKTESEHTGIYTTIIPNYEKYLVKTKYQMSALTDGKVTSQGDSYSDYVSLLNVNDYILANGMDSFFNNKQLFYLLGYDENGAVLHVEEDGSIQSGDFTEGYGIRPVITLKPNTVITSGVGTIEDPYLISVGDDYSSFGAYVKLGEDLWRVYGYNEEYFKLSLNSYISYNGEEFLRKYSQNDSFYDIMDATNIGYYLNRDYLNSLVYKDYLVPYTSYIGEISEDQGYNYLNIYGNTVRHQVGLLNIFDPIVNVSLADYFHINNTSSFGGMQYIRYANGLLAEADIGEAKHIVPAVSIERKNITSGTGTLADPYIVG